MAQQVGQLSVSLRAAMAPLFLSFSLRDSTTTSLPTSNSNNPSTPTLQEAFSRRPFALTAADISPLIPSLDSTELKSTMEAVYAQVNDVAKEWVAKQAATGIAIELSVLIQWWCGNEWSLLSDMQGQLSSPTSEPAPPKEDVLLVAQAFAGARIRQSTSGRNSIAFIGSYGCGKSSVINAIVGFPLIEAGSEYHVYTDIPLLSLSSAHLSTLSNTTSARPIGTNFGGRNRAISYRLRALAPI